MDQKAWLLVSACFAAKQLGDGADISPLQASLGLRSGAFLLYTFSPVRVLTSLSIAHSPSRDQMAP